MEMEIEIGRQAKEELVGALAADPIENTALVVFENECEECYGVGFEVILVEEREVPPVGYVWVGEGEGWPVYVAAAVAPSVPSRLIINVDLGNSRLAALFLETDKGK
jgi:hypothetical protein